jgi:hypothetical protein
MNNDIGTNINTNVNFQGHVHVNDKETGKTIANQIGLAGCIAAMTGGVAKTIAKSSIPPVQKAGLVVGSGIVGAVLHAGSNFVNAQNQAIHSISKSSTNIDKDIIPKNVNSFLDFTSDISPLEGLLLCINTLTYISIWLFTVLILQILFKVYISDRPKLTLLDSVLPSYSEKIKTYIYKFIKLNKQLNIIYSIWAIVLLFICILALGYFSSEIYHNLSDYVNVYLQYKK